MHTFDPSLRCIFLAIFPFLSVYTPTTAQPRCITNCITGVFVFHLAFSWLASFFRIYKIFWTFLTLDLSKLSWLGLYEDCILALLLHIMVFGLLCRIYFIVLNQGLYPCIYFCYSIAVSDFNLYLRQKAARNRLESPSGRFRKTCQQHASFQPPPFTAPHPPQPSFPTSHRLSTTLKTLKRERDAIK